MSDFRAFGQADTHIVRRIIHRALQETHDLDEQADLVMDRLNELGLVSYQTRERGPLFTVAGRMAMLLMEDSGQSARELSVRMGVTEANVQRGLKQLREDGSLTRKRVGKSMRHEINPLVLFTHPDMLRLAQAMIHVSSEYAAKNDENASSSTGSNQT